MKRTQKGIHLVSEHEGNGAQRQRTFPIRRYGYLAEIMRSKAGDRTVFHYLVQRENSTGILHWGQEFSEQRALESIEEFLQEVAKKRA